MFNEFYKFFNELDKNFTCFPCHAIFDWTKAVVETSISFLVGLKLFIVYWFAEGDFLKFFSQYLY